MFNDDFESGAGNWNITQSIWTLTADDTTVFTSANQGNEARAVAGDPTWTDLTVSARLKITSMGDSRRIHLAARYIDADNWYGAAFRNTGTRVVAIRKKVGGDSENIGTTEVPFAFVEGTWYHVRFQIAGNELTMWVDDVRIASGTDDTFAQGSITLLADRCVVSWDDIVVTVP